MAKCIMIQGTMSNAGKSLLVAGLCRLFKQDGYRVAPFKSQNMALNSFITEDGFEMGRAQVVQAEAAGVTPRVEMNPILLKPTSDVGSQVIVNGISIGNQKAKEYFAFKKQLIPEIMKAYETLDKEYDIIVIEGAGSPAEINLKENDIVNMGLANMLNAPVLLVGDIDRGGVFAQLYGTVMLLPQEEQARIKGLIINKFRGDKTILDPGIVMLESLCNIPVAGVVPYLNVEIEAEDSLSEKSVNREHAMVEIAVIRFPRISNFTDVEVFSLFPQVRVRYVEKFADLKHPDLIILPGTKNTIDDLLWMRQNGLEAGILKLSASGVTVFGICGGYQMMGRSLCDPYGVESSHQGKVIAGMDLLPITTRYEKEKVRTRVKGRIGELTGTLSELSKLQIEGYEIHMGETIVEGKHLCSLREDQNSHFVEKWDGCYQNHCYGSYVHGLFDHGEVAKTVVICLLKEKGISFEMTDVYDYQSFRESQYDSLAGALRQGFDMREIYKMMGMDEGV